MVAGLRGDLGGCVFEDALFASFFLDFFAGFFVAGFAGFFTGRFAFVAFGFDFGVDVKFGQFFARQLELVFGRRQGSRRNGEGK